MRLGFIVLAVLAVGCGKDEGKKEAAEVAVAGENGDAGVDGKDGADGHDGADGKDGSKGERGEKGEPGQMYAQNEWRDPITGYMWVLGGNSTVATGCGNGYRLPSLEEGKIAVLNGIMLASKPLGGAQYMWTNLNSRQLDSAGNMIYPNVAVAGVYCVKLP